MDPNYLLAAAREAAARLSEYSDSALIHREAERLREVFLELDAYLSQGGSLPDCWAQHRRCTGDVWEGCGSYKCSLTAGHRGEHR